jgi:hypothetical protein
VRTPQLATRSVRILAVPLLLAGVAAGAAAAVPAVARARSQDVPVSVPSTGQLSGVAATSASNAWAVGYTGSTSPKPLIEHWNGTAWTRVPSPGGASSVAATALGAARTRPTTMC